MQNFPNRRQFPTRSGRTNPGVTSAVGLPETAGRVRARRSSLFTQTIIWITGLICLAFLLASLAQAWSNSQLVQRVQTAQQQLQHMQQHHDTLTKLAAHYQDPFVIENEARQQLYEELLRVLAQDLVPLRPGRREPRALKRRKKPYPSLTCHRSRFREIFPQKPLLG